ncbi:MAG: hypothetical protein ACQCXQ_00950, partial [Verrucomicrobiales bacterium]
IVAGLRDALAAYFPVAKALADDDDEQAKAASVVFQETVVGLPRPEWQALVERAERLAAAADIKSRRAALFAVSASLIEMVRVHGIDQVGDLFVVHCPMAFGGKGGDWLSAVPTVLNPYFGDAMLTCGNLTDTLSIDTEGPAKAQDPPMKPEPDHSGH